MNSMMMLNDDDDDDDDGVDGVDRVDGVDGVDKREGDGVWRRRGICRSSVLRKRIRVSCATDCSLALKSGSS